MNGYGSQLNAQVDRLTGLRCRRGAMVLFLIVRVTLAAEQPIAYSHKVHIDGGMQCLDCHSNADMGSRATIPSVAKCMLCHAQIAKDKPEIKKIAEYAAAKREIPWERVYNFNPGALVEFQHAPHIRAKVQCARCHGDMTQAVVTRRLVKHNMGTCLTCHRQNHAPEDCVACHE